MPFSQPDITPEFAELVGIIIGDGNLYSNHIKGIYQLKIGLNSIKEKEYAFEFVIPILQKIFGIQFKHYETLKNELFIYANSKAIVECIREWLTDKHRIPSWIFGNELFIKSCIRGLIDTDGTVFSKTTNDSIPQIEFTQKNLGLIDDVHIGLKFLGIDSCIRFNKNKNTYELGIYKKSEVEKYFETIGFNNNKNLKRYLRIRDNHASVV